jgi:hypothetical protein
MEIFGEGIRKSFKRFENKVEKLDAVLTNIKIQEKLIEIIDEEILELTNKYNTATNPKKAELYLNKIKKAEKKYNSVISKHNKYITLYDDIVAESKKIKKDYEALKKMKLSETEIGKKIVKSSRSIKKIDKSLNKKIEEAEKKFKTAVKKPERKEVVDNKAKDIERAKKAVEKVKNKNIELQALGKEPKKIKQLEGDRIKFFHKVRFEYSNIATYAQLYNAIIDEKFKLGINLTYVVLFIVDTDDNVVRHISIGGKFTSTYEKFESRILEILAGKADGSDAINNKKEKLNLDYFELAYSDATSAYGKSDKILFECENINNGLCGFECLKKCGFVYNGNAKDLITMDKMIEVIKCNNLKISIIGNTFRFKNINNIISRKSREIKIMYKKKEIDIDVWDLLIDDIDICKIYNAYETNYTIVYDEINKHFDVISNNKIKLQEKICMDFSGDIYKNNISVFTSRELIKNDIMLNNQDELEYVFFDYETVIDFEESSCMKEYSLSILRLNNKQLEDLTNADIKGDAGEVERIRQKCCITFLGYDCSLKFINWIIENQKNKIFCFIGFNNTNFDNFIFLNALLKNKNNAIGEYSTSEIFYNGSQLLNFKMNGRHHTFDIHKHLMGSLRDNCESFKIKCCKKLEFNHNKAQQLYLDNKLIDFITGNQELKDYNEFDVLATAVLFCKYRKALENIPATKPYTYNLTDTKTIGSLIFKVFDDYKKTKKFNLPALSFKQYEDLQKYKIAGRVELFNGAKEIEERLVSTDVCSLYPFVMAVLNCYYPCGDTIKEVKKYQGDDKIGFYYCDIDQTNLKASDLPNIYAEKLPLENKWDSQNELKDYLISNVMIGLLRKYKCKVVIKNGFIFEDKMKSCDMFGFLLDFMKAKNNQDTLKKNKDDNYNSALRETLKLLMNSLSGKVIEGLHTEKTVSVETIAEYEKIKNNSESINVINNIGDKIFITYEVNAETLIKQQRPIYLGVLIYDYAKRYMYENSYSKVGLSKLLYTDTDASKFRYKDFELWKNWVDKSNIQVPHWKEVEEYDERYKDHKIFVSGSKVFGSFEDELEDMVGDEYIFYCIEKKSWLYAYKKDGKWNSKFRFKGLNGSALMLTLDEEFVKNKIVKHCAKENKPAWEEKIYYIEPYSEEKVYQYYVNNKQKSIEDGNEIAFYKQIFETGEGYVLTQSFRKIVKNLSRNVNIDDENKYNNLINNIQVNITMKHININKK